MLETGLALAGGGVSGSVAVGVIRALEEAGIRISHIAGASSGSIVAALYAYGFSTEELMQVVPRLNRRYLDFDLKGTLQRLLLYRPNLDGWFKGNKLRNLIKELTHNEDVSKFKIPCGIVATDLDRGIPVIFSNQTYSEYETWTNISIAEAVRASFAIPVVFQPVHMRDCTLVDGGVVMNCPVKLVKEMGATHVISVDSIAAFVKNRRARLTSALSIFYRVVNITLQTQMQRQHEHADLTLYPNVGAVGALEFHKVQHCIEVGYEYTLKRMDEIKEMLSKSN